MQESLVALECNARGGELFTVFAVDGVHRLAQGGAPEFCNIRMCARPSSLEFADLMVRRRVAGRRHLTPCADHALITEGEVGDLSDFSGDTLIETQDVSSEDIIRLVFFAAG